jgi:alpha-ketoglutaric semialdehyde dehydrogenase
MDKDFKEIGQILIASESASKLYSHYSGKKKADFLRQIAVEIEHLGDNLIETAANESHLPLARLTGERARTTGQLRLFAEYLEEGSWVDAVIDLAIPDRQPLPKVDLRKMLVPIGPVVIFGASNFPLAFSTAGGDTASALAAGCSVIVKGHPAHIKTSTLVASAIQSAALKTKMPTGVFAHVEGGIEVGQFLTQHPIIKAVAFTGSYTAGKSLFDLANKRKQPIPVFAEMGSVNPVILFPASLKERSESLATQLADSVTLGVGQFCTNPGLLIGLESEELTAFSNHFTCKMMQKNAAPMLHEGIAQNFEKTIENFSNLQDINIHSIEKDGNKLNGHPAVGIVSGATFLNNIILHQEVFGPFSLIVACKDINELNQIMDELKGQLTITIMAESSDLTSNKSLLETIREKCGRLILNNVPTGVEVTHAMNHGGPFPATTDTRFTSVGTSAILRFVRPLCYQNFPDDLLPDALKDNNPLSIWRKINGVLTK